MPGRIANAETGNRRPALSVNATVPATAHPGPDGGQRSREQQGTAAEERTRLHLMILHEAAAEDRPEGSDSANHGHPDAPAPRPVLGHRAAFVGGFPGKQSRGG